MHYRCNDCGAEQWRGFFPESKWNWRYLLFHAAALSSMAVLVRGLLEFVGFKNQSPIEAVIAFAVGGAVLMGIYGIAFFVESLFVERRGCEACGSHDIEIIGA